MELNKLSKLVAAPHGDQLLFEIHRALIQAGQKKPHMTFHHLLNALHLLVNQNILYFGTPGLDHPNERGAMVQRELMPPVPGGMVAPRKRRSPPVVNDAPPANSSEVVKGCL